MKRSSIILLGIIAIVIIIGAMLVGSYNGLVAQRESVTNSFRNIDTQLQRRADLIPNLVNTVKGFAAQEKSIIQSITDARAKLAGAQTVGQKANADAQLTGALKGLLVVVENYPNIKSDANFRQLSDELAGTENRITVSRLDYNGAVKTYNTQIKSFPTNLMAGLFGFKEAEYFEATDNAKVVPKATFS